MKCLIYVPEERGSWVHDFFPGTPPLMLKIVNKPYLEYLIDFCVQHRIQDIRIVLSDTVPAVEQAFGDGRKWGVRLSYQLAKPGDSIRKTVLKNKAFTAGEDLLIIHGFLFPSYAKDKPPKSLKRGSALDTAFNPRLIIRDGSEGSYFAVESGDFPVQAIDGIRSFYDLNMEIISSRRRAFILPGYNSEDGLYIGRQFIYPKDVSILKPVMAGNQVQLKPGVTLGPDAVLGDHIIIDEDSGVKSSIIMDGVYIGSRLDVVGKIVYKNRIIDPKTGDVLHVTDAFLISEIQRNVFAAFFSWLVQYVFAWIFFIAGIPFAALYMLSAVFTVKNLSRQVLCRTAEARVKVRIPNFRKPFGSGAGFYRRFMIDKWRLIPRVLFFRLNLSGNRLIPRSPLAAEMFKLLPAWNAGVFSLMDTIPDNVSDEEYKIHELFYHNNVSLGTDLRIFFLTIGRRLSGK